MRNKFNARKVHWCLDCHAATVEAIEIRAKKSGRVRKEYRCTVDPTHKTVCFDSRKEHKRYVELKLLEKAGQIRDLETHRKFDLDVPAIHAPVYGTIVTVGTFSPDFCYREGHQRVVEDVKGHMNAPQKCLFELKCNLMKALYGIEVRVI